LGKFQLQNRKISLSFFRKNGARKKTKMWENFSILEFRESGTAEAEHLYCLFHTSGRPCPKPTHARTAKKELPNHLENIYFRCKIETGKSLSKY
jgi:hypothetical protein